MPFASPIVRTRRMPPAADPLRWRETGDIPAAIAVIIIAAVGPLLGAVAVMQAANAQSLDRALLIAALAGACAELAASYRQALTRLCEQLDKPVLISDASHVLREWPIKTLDEWLQPPSS